MNGSTYKPISPDKAIELLDKIDNRCYAPMGFTFFCSHKMYCWLQKEMPEFFKTANVVKFQIPKQSIVSRFEVRKKVKNKKNSQYKKHKSTPNDHYQPTR